MLEVAGIAVAGGLLAWVYSKERGHKDADKIQKIAKYCNLRGENKEGIHLLTKRVRKWGTEYVYRIPLGLSFDDFQGKRKNFEDGINLRNHLLRVPTIAEIKKLRLDKTLPLQIRKLLTYPIGRKEVILDFDGTLIIRVYNSEMPKEVSVTQQDLDECKGWNIWIGESREGRIYHDFEKRPHMIVAGATGFGKSEYVKLLITILANSQPKNVKFHLIDLKGGTELGRFRDMKQTIDFGRNPEQAKDILTDIKDKMEERLDWLYDNGFKDVKQAGIKERHFVIIDEAADIADNRDCMKAVTDIARRGRSAGYRLIYATQYPTNETLPSQVRANIGSRIIYRLETEAQSRACLDEGGAEKLPEIEGRAIFRRVSNKIVQTPLIKEDLIEKVVKVNIRAKKEEKKVEFTKRAKGGRDIIIIEET